MSNRIVIEPTKFIGTKSGYESLFKNKAVGKHQCALLEFAEKYGVNRWHSYANDRTTKRAVAGGVKRGWLKINEYNQFSLVLPS